MRRILTSLLLLLSVVSISLARTITGIVLSDTDSTAVAGATCKLLSQQKIVKGTSSEVNGFFSIETDLKSNLSLEVSMTGFETTEIIIENGSKNINLGNVYLNEGVTLNEVTVTANTPINSKGRTILFPSMADVKASATSLSLFQKLSLPGLAANPINRSISVDGGAPTILINGIPSTLEDFNALQPKDIEKVEYSRMTPARYADKGTTGLISITLKKRNDGGQVYAWARSATQTAFLDANIRGSYHQGPSQFTLFYNPSWRNYHKVFDSSSEQYIADDFHVDLKTTDRNPFNYFTQTMRLKYDYSPDINTLFSATFRATPTTNSRKVYGHSEDSFLGDYDFNNSSYGKTFSPSLDLFLRRDFNSKNSLELQLVGTLSSDKYRRENQYLFSDNKRDVYEMDIDSRRLSLISEICYIHNFSDNTSLSAGFQNTVSRSTNTYLASDYKPVLTENNNYIYARLGQQVGKVYISLATGAKLFWIENDLNKRHFIRNLSSAQISWNIDSHWTISGNCSYSPRIPSLSSLTDYPQQTTPYLISNGNPNLKVAENISGRLNFNYKTGKFSAGYSVLLFNSTNNTFSDVVYAGDRLFLSQSVNAKSYGQLQNDLTLGLSDINGFGANLYLSYCHYRSELQQWKQTLNAFTGNITLWWSKGPVTISYWRTFPGKYLSGTTIYKDENGDALQFDYRPDKHWSIGLSWMYMFDKKGTRYPNWNNSPVHPSIVDRYIKNNSNMVVVSLTYSTDFGSIFRTARRNLNNSDNSSSILKL